MNIIVIPARMDSKRFPGKPLAMAGGSTLLEHVYNRACNVPLVNKVIVTTPDEIIYDYCEKTGVGVECIMTHEGLPNGTARVAAAVQSLGLKEDDHVINWQVDEPVIDVGAVHQLLQMPAISTLVWGPGVLHEQSGPDTVKCIVSNGLCRWFTRHPIVAAAKMHIGVYGFTNITLGAVAHLAPSQAAEMESLEQLTWLDAGHTIAPIMTNTIPMAINTPADFAAFKKSVES